MDPYKIPQTELQRTNPSPPPIVKLSVVMIAVSGLFGVINIFLQTNPSFDAKSWDPFSIALNAGWLAILVWFCNDILAARSNPKFALIGLALVVLYFGFEEPVSLVAILTTVAEMLGYVVSFFLLNRPTSGQWFNGSAEE